MAAKVVGIPLQKVLRVDIWHSILWSRYKARVFGDLYQIANKNGAEFRFFHIAETSDNRLGLGVADIADHAYPHVLLFRGSYDRVSKVRLYAKCFWLVWRSPADLIVLQGYGEGEYWLQALAVLMRGKKLAVNSDATIYDHEQVAIKLVLKRLFFSFCSGVMCYGERAVSYVRSMGVPKTRIWTRCQAPALPQNYSVADALAKRTSHHLDSSKPRVLFVGRLAPEKGVAVLLKAFQLLLEDYPGATLAIVGSGPEQANLQALVAELGLGSMVEFAGPRVGEALWDEILRSNCLVLPSIHEPWGLVANEALSYGCPIVVSDHCGCVPELVIENRTGYVARAGDAEDLASKIGMALKLSYNCEETAKACVEVASQYTSERSAAQIFQACQSIVQGGGPAT